MILDTTSNSASKAILTSVQGNLATYLQNGLNVQSFQSTGLKGSLLRQEKKPRKHARGDSILVTQNLTQKSLKKASNKKDKIGPNLSTLLSKEINNAVPSLKT